MPGITAVIYPSSRKALEGIVATHPTFLSKRDERDILIGQVKKIKA